MTGNFYAHGKLLLTAEYFVLDGAKALALPCKLGQSMTVRALEIPEPVLKWKSLDHENKVWFEADFDRKSLACLHTSEQSTAIFLQKILQAARRQNPMFLSGEGAIIVETKLEFPRLWGLGSSSTLIYNIALWSKTDPYKLLSDTFGGSGYDIACASASGPVVYQLKDDLPVVTPCDFHPVFREQLHFIYLGKKQNSRDGIAHYRKNIKDHAQVVETLNAITEKILETYDLDEFILLLAEHENLISTTLQIPRVQDRYFPDFRGVVKSLGAWGGDFVLVASPDEETKTKKYFNEKGFDVFFRYDELIL